MEAEALATALGLKLDLITPLDTMAMTELPQGPDTTEVLTMIACTMTNTDLVK